MAVKYVSDINGWTKTEGIREENSEENFWIWERGWQTCSVVNDMICNRIKSYETCVGHMALNVKKGKPTLFWWRNMK